MVNMKEEFLEQASERKVICVSLEYGCCYDKGKKKFLLKVGHSDEEYNEFLKEIDFEYDEGYGGQMLEGVIWCENEIWFERREYDGSEWWELNCYPNIPNELK